MIKAIFFDLDDTLLWDQMSVKLAFQATCKIAEEKYGIDPEHLEEAVRRNARQLYSSYPTYPFTQLIGINPMEGLWAEFNDEGKGWEALREIKHEYREKAWTLGLKDVGIDNPQFGYELGETFPKKRKMFPVVYDDTFSVLNEVKKKYRLLLLTNGSPALQKTKLSLTPELVPYFEHIVISGEYGKGKPDPGIYNYALDKMQVNKDEVIMVGDNLKTDILGANRIGIRSVWINRDNKKQTDILSTYEISELKHLIEVLNLIEGGGKNE